MMRPTKKNRESQPVKTKTFRDTTKYPKPAVFIKIAPAKKGAIKGFYIDKASNRIIKVFNRVIDIVNKEAVEAAGYKVITGQKAEDIMDQHLDEIQAEQNQPAAIFPQDEVARWPKEFNTMINRFESTREFQLGSESLGVMSQRGEHYKMPMKLDDPRFPQFMKTIEAFRHELRSMNIQPDQTYEIPWAVEGKIKKILNDVETVGKDQAIKIWGKKAVDKAIENEEDKDYFYEWKPHRVELYGINRDGLDKIARDAIATKRLVRIASIHGAEHSVAMLITLLEQGIPFDFCYYTELPTEQMDEYDYVKYYVQALAMKFGRIIPLVVVVPQDSAETYFERKAIYPREDKRWCTMALKLNPYKKLLKDIFYNKLEPGDYVDILQFLGMQAFQSEGRASLNPYATPSFLSLPPPYEETPEEKERKRQAKAKQKQNQALGERVMRGGKEWLANWPSTDMNQWQRLMQNGTLPNRTIMRVFDMLPVFKFSHEDDLAMLERHGIKRNPNSLFFGRHGCVLCPFASWEYYHQLKMTYPEIYAEACKIRDMASEHGIHKKEGESGYLAKRWTQFKKVTRAMERAGYRKGGPTPF
jgi:3'-phosphoadenosine 5'-phosphosulfate sulfotransferase (PAPS reductase)/FAD synthetase